MPAQFEPWGFTTVSWLDSGCEQPEHGADALPLRMRGHVYCRVQTHPLLVRGVVVCRAALG